MCGKYCWWCNKELHENGYSYLIRYFNNSNGVAQEHFTETRIVCNKCHHNIDINTVMHNANPPMGLWGWDVYWMSEYCGFNYY